ncbi:MAG: hypothetical protein ABR526_08950 [Chthoniobacterales bacterium]
MKRTITKQHALAIAKKLKATMREEKAHAYADIFHGEKLVAWFGIRRGSRKDQGHGHIQNDLYVNPYQARLLAACPLTRDQWLKIMDEKGRLT